ncbi:MAG: hypothetical protein ACJA2S_005759 [Cyclobacteriaceae bacterium]
MKIAGSKESRAYKYEDKIFKFLDWFDSDFVINAEGYESKRFNFSVAEVKLGELLSIEVNLDKAAKKEGYQGEIELIQIGDRCVTTTSGSGSRMEYS